MAVLQQATDQALRDQIRELLEKLNTANVSQHASKSGTWMLLCMHACLVTLA